MTDTAEHPAPAPAKKAPRRPLWRAVAKWSAVTLGVLLALLVLAGVGAVYGVRTDAGRKLVVDFADGLSLGRFGKLQLSGLSGDLLRDPRIQRLAIVDRDGVWLEARDVRLLWRSGELLQRRFHAERIEAGLIRVYRQPHPEPPSGPEKPAPVTVVIDAARVRLELEPALATRKGVFDVSASVTLGRTGPYVGRVNAASLLRKGDGLDADFRVKDGDRFRVNARAVEAQGGALAGTIGLAADRPFRLDLNANGASAGGELFLLARSGDERPAEANGRWSKAGGSVRGRFALGASKLTAALAESFGPEVGFDLTGRPVRTDVYTVGGRLASENVTLTLAGPVNTKEQASPEGVRVRAEIADVSRFVPQIEAGAGVAEGVISRGLEDLLFRGTAQVRAVGTPQFRLATLAGPVEVERRRGDIDIRLPGLRGEGGAGEGVVAALVGRSPRADGVVTLLADRRTLIRSFSLQGAGIRANATGTRGLLGDLSFRGEATLSNLAQAAPGASGSLSGGWSARNGGAGRPWEIGFDGRGARFTSGLPELDRLLGQTPRLQLTADYEADGDFRVERAALTGSAAEASAEGLLTPAGVLGFDLDWSARGPFQAGPITIGGAANGDGWITGTLTAPRADLVANVDEIDMERITLTNARLTLSFLRTPAGGDAAFAIASGSEYGPARASGEVEFVQGGVDLRNLLVDAGGVRGGGSLALRDGAPSRADLNVTVGPGVLLTQGQASGTVRLVDGPGDPRATLSLEGANLIVRGAEGTPIDRIRLTGDGPLSRLPFQVSVAAPSPAPFEFDGRGVFSRTGEVNAVSLEGRGEAREIAFSTTEPLLVRVGPGEQSVRARLAVGGGRAAVDARLAGQAVTATATLDGVEVSTFSPDYAGRANARATLQGQGAWLTGSLEAQLDNARSLDAPDNLAVDGQVRATLTDQRLRVVASASNPAGLRAETDVDLPVEASAQPLRLAVNRTQPIRGTFAANGELRSLWDLFFGAERTLSGQLAANGTIGGTLNSPRATGVANVTNGQFRDAATGLELRNLTLAADLADTAVVVRELSAADGGRGRLQGQGRIGLTRGAASTFTATLTRFQFLDSELGEATASGDLEMIRNAAGENTLRGRLTVDEAEIAANPPAGSQVITIDVVERNAPVRPGDRRRATPAAAGATTAGGPAVNLDVTVSAARGIFVRGRGLDLELALDARVRGTTAAPELTGVARVFRGDYEFAGKRFEFDDRGSIRLATDPALIRLDLTAVRDDPALTARVRATGTALEPLITLSSTPELPQDEILSQVLFGRSASQLSPLEAAQLAAAVASLASGGGFDVIGGLRSLAGLDRLTLGGGAAGPTVAGGKYLTDDVYLEIIGGGRRGPAAEVDWRVRRNLSIVSRVGGEVGTRLSVRYRRSF